MFYFLRLVSIVSSDGDATLAGFELSITNGRVFFGLGSNLIENSPNNLG